MKLHPLAHTHVDLFDNTTCFSDFLFEPRLQKLLEKVVVRFGAVGPISKIIAFSLCYFPMGGTPRGTKKAVHSRNLGELR